MCLGSVCSSIRVDLLYLASVHCTPEYEAQTPYCLPRGGLPFAHFRPPESGSQLQ